jgi:filamentous hemagglutinin
LATSNGSVWVSGNGTKHLAEYATSMLRREVPVEVVNIGTQTQLQSLQAAVNQATTGGLPLGKIVNVGGWEMKFGPPRQPGQLPVLFHALPKP